jgi:formylglycine-generating enzyme required for sulfatase activity
VRLVAAFACAVMLMCLDVASGHAEKRVALVIGNGAYSKVPPLTNPPNDASAIAGLLRAAGFDIVQAKTNLDLASMRRALRDFAEAMRDAEVVVVFFAGHGIEVNGTNYLIPTDAVLERDTDVEDETVSLDRISRIIDPAKQLRVVILDACRDNPFTAKMKRTIGNRSIERGLGRVDVVTADTLVAFAARAGSTASDGVGPNSPYTTALLQHLVTPGLDVRIALGRVRDQVLLSTGGKQEPFVYGSLGGGEISLARKVTVEPVPPPVTSQFGEAGQAWSIVQNTSDARVLEAFVKRYGDSFYGDLARMRIDDLKKTPILTPTPPREQSPTPAQQRPQVALVPPPVAPSSPCGGVTLASLTSRAAQPLSAGEECALKTKDVFKECDKCPEMVVVPAGSFTMGSPTTESDRFDNEGPQHLVTIGKPFAVGRFAVTFEEWDACVADGGCNGYKPDDKGWGRGRQPVINVSWADVKTYVAWLSRKTGKTYRLLSEAEREYVTRAGTTTPFWWGASISTSQANYDGNYTYGGGSKGEYRKQTLPVDSFQPNPFGLYQVHGNVYDWVEDCYNDSYVGAPKDALAWLSGDCSRRILRGGSWFIYAKELRAARRGGTPSDTRDIYFGFRLGRTL